MSDPTQVVPAADGPDGPGGPGGAPPPMDRRKVAIIVLAVVIVLLLVLLAVALANDSDSGDGDEVGVTSSTIDSTTSTTEPTSTSEATTTTTTEATTTTTEAPTTTAAPQQTIPPERCTGQTSPDEPEPVAVVFYDSWTVGDRICAEQVANQDAIDTLFDNDGSGANWTFQGCSTFEDPEPKIDCAFTYEGGSSHFEMQYGAINGWQVVAVDFVAD